MARSVEALVRPALLLWARKSAGLSVVQAAKKVQVKAERLESWERGERRPTVKQLRKLANTYKRPLAVFYLSEPPKDFQAIRDFRSLPGEIAGVESPGLKLEIRRAQERREIALELYEGLEDELPKFPAKAHLSDDPEALAIGMRRLVRMTREAQTLMATGYDAFNRWRSALEEAGILVFQARGIPVSEMRGFSIGQRPLPAVVVNIKDAPRGRVFTMLHELVHIVLGDSGLCDLEEEAYRHPEEDRVETFCNRVAGAILVPKDDLLREDLVLAKGRRVQWSDDDIEELAGRYAVSREVLLRRLLIFNRTTKEFYEKKRKQFIKQYDEIRKRETSGFPPHYRLAISTAGPLFIRLVFNNYYQDKITTSDLSGFLNIKLKHVGRIESEVMGHKTVLGATA